MWLALELLACVVVGVAWDASSGTMGQTAHSSQRTTRPTQLDSRPPSSAGYLVSRGLPIGEQHGASLYNAKVLQFCSTVMPQDVCSAAAAKWLYPHHQQEGSLPDRTLRTMSVSIRAGIDVKRLDQRKQRVAENVTGIVNEELALLDLSSALQSLHGWGMERGL